MSIVYINEHDECIYDVIKNFVIGDHSADMGFKRYQSKYRFKIKNDLEKLKSKHRTMGLAKIEPPVPMQYLKQKPHAIWPPKTNQIICKDHKKPPVPRFQKRNSPDPKIGSCPSKNFIVDNIAKAIQKTPDKPLARIVDTCRGNTFLLTKSGLDPIYMKSPDFGKTPKYLEKRKWEICKNISKESKVESMKQCRHISDEERMELLEKLIEKRELLMKRFMLLPLVTDTISKILTKSTLENKLAQLDKDINMVDTHQRLAVS